MWWQYLKAVGVRALWFTPRWTDGLQVIAASALPGIARFAGIEMPDAVGSDALAYIGAATVAFVVIRLFWAPYALWKEQCAEIGDLKFELSKPERIELQVIRKRRAKARMKLASQLRSIHWLIYADLLTAEAFKDRQTRVFRLGAEINPPRSFYLALKLFTDAIHKLTVSEKGSPDYNDAVKESHRSIDLMICYLHGEITVEDLALQLPSDIADEPQ